MCPAIPANITLDKLKKRAKTILSAHKAGDSSCCELLRMHPRLKNMSDEDILKATIALREVQHALAVEHGFKSWAKLRNEFGFRKAEDDAAGNSSGKVEETPRSMSTLKKNVIFMVPYLLGCIIYLRFDSAVSEQISEIADALMTLIAIAGLVWANANAFIGIQTKWRRIAARVGIIMALYIALHSFVFCYAWPVRMQPDRPSESLKTPEPKMLNEHAIYRANTVSISAKLFTMNPKAIHDIEKTSHVALDFSKHSLLEQDLAHSVVEVFRKSAGVRCVAEGTIVTQSGMESTLDSHSEPAVGSGIESTNVPAHSKFILTVLPEIDPSSDRVHLIFKADYTLSYNHAAKEQHVSTQKVSMTKDMILSTGQTLLFPVSQKAVQGDDDQLYMMAISAVVMPLVEAK